MNKEKLSQWLHDYFYQLDEPPATRLLVPIDKIVQDPDDSDAAFATLVYVYASNEEKVNKAKIRFNYKKLDKVDFDVNYQYVSDY